MALNSSARTFTAQSAMVHRFGLGTHQVKVRAVDAAGHVLWARTIVVAVVTVLPETDTIGETAQGAGRPFAMVLVLIVGIATFVGFLILPPRRRRQPLP